MARKNLWFYGFRLLLSVAVVVFASGRRAAAAEGQWQAGGRAGVSWLGSPGWGPSAEAFLRYGLGDSLDLDVQLLASLDPFQPSAKMAPNSAVDDSLPWIAGVAPALLYRWDVLRVIPYAGAGVGAYASDGLTSHDEGIQFGVCGRAGVEYLLSRDVVLSAQLSAHLALTESSVPSPWIQLGVGAGYVWGW